MPSCRDVPSFIIMDLYLLWLEPINLAEHGMRLLMTLLKPMK